MNITTDRKVDPANPEETPGPRDPATIERRTFTAYEIYHHCDMPLVPAPIDRCWMDETHLRFAYRCLPLAIANQAGWVILNPAGFTARWNGGALGTDTTIEFDDSGGHPSVTSHFGYGIVTFNVPYLFRTPGGVNLWVKGPSNWIRDGAQALEGIVETDWSTAPFTMNWKLTRPHITVRFQPNEPICMLVPVPRGLMESLEPRQIPLRSDPALEQQYRAWDSSRHEFQTRPSSNDPDTVRRGWQRDYFHGQNTDGEAFDGHQTKLTVREFVRSEA